MPTVEQMQLQQWCRLNPTCSLLYGQHLKTNHTAFDVLSRTYSTKAPFNVTAIMLQMADPAFAMTRFLIAEAREPLCPGGRFWKSGGERGGECVDVLHLVNAPVPTFNALLVVLVIALLLGLLGMALKINKDRNARKEAEAKAAEAEALRAASGQRAVTLETLQATARHFYGDNYQNPTANDGGGGGSVNLTWRRR